MSPCRLPVCLRAAALWLLLATPALADVLILDNGTVLKGRVLKYGDPDVVVQLDGFRGEARVTIERRRIVKRYQVDAPKRGTPLVPEPHAPAAPADEARAAVGPEVELVSEEVLVAETQAPTRWASPVEEPAAEPPMHREGFFERLARVALVGMPQDPVGRAALAALLLVGLMALIGLGGRIAEVETLTFGRAAGLAALLGAILAADVAWSAEMLRADRAIWVLPTQGVAWFVAAMGILRENAGRVILLFAFVLFSLTVAIFTAGAILVSY